MEWWGSCARELCKQSAKCVLHPQAVTWHSRLSSKVARAQRHVASFCARARNAYARKNLKADFADGMAEMVRQAGGVPPPPARAHTNVLLWSGSCIAAWTNRELPAAPSVCAAWEHSPSTCSSCSRCEPVRCLITCLYWCRQCTTASTC